MFKVEDNPSLERLTDAHLYGNHYCNNNFHKDAGNY